MARESKHVRKRKTPRPRLYLGNLRGVALSDPGGLAIIEPFTNTGEKFLDDTGHFTNPFTGPGALGWAPLTTGAEPIQDVSDGAGVHVMVPFEP